MQRLFCASPMVPTIGEARPRVVVRLWPRNIDVGCYEQSRHQAYETRGCVAASELAPERHRHTTDDAAALDINTYLGTARCNHFKGGGSAQMKKWKGLCRAMARQRIMWIDVTVLPFLKQLKVQAKNKKNRSQGCIRKPQTDAPLSQISAQLPSQRGKAKNFSPWWFCCCRKFWPLWYVVVETPKYVDKYTCLRL